MARAPRRPAAKSPGPTFFESAAAFRRWLARHHATATELFVGLRKVHVKPRGITYSEALDEALCYGWIDGVRLRLHEDAFQIRFSPRKRGSIWSNINTVRARALVKAGRMAPSGRTAFAARDPKRAGIYAFERGNGQLDAASKRVLRANAKAWGYFSNQPAGYQRTAGWWVMSAKRPETRARRLAQLLADSARAQRIGPMRGRKPA